VISTLVSSGWTDIGAGGGGANALCRPVGWSENLSG
jgi:hypothetical protein